MGNQLDVRTFIDQRKFGGYQWIIFVLCFAVITIDGFDVAAIGYVAPSLIKEWGISRADLGPVFSAALFGLMGALVAGPLADRFGRKWILFFTVLTIGVFCLATVSVNDVGGLTILRFLTGLGLGMAMPCAITLMAEFIPTPRRALLLNLVFCGFPIGAAFGGFLSAWMIPQFGWRSVFIVGGVAPLILSLLILLMLPESVRFLVEQLGKLNASQTELKEKINTKISGILSKLANKPVISDGFYSSETKPVTNTKQSSIRLILSPSYRIGTIMLWIVYFMGLVIFYGMISWMPILFKDAGIPPQQAILITALFPLGGLGAVFSGWLMDKFNANWVVAVFFLFTAISIFSIGQTASNIGILVVVVFMAGVFMNTAQSSTASLASAFYPTAGRATGVAWMMGVGRLGGMFGAFLVTQLQIMHMSFSGVFTVVAIPALLAAAALYIKQKVHPDSAEKLDAGVVAVH